MYYNGKNVTLREYIDIRYKEGNYANKPEWSWKDEGIVWAIVDYLGSMGEFSDEDVECLVEHGFVPEDFGED